MDTNRIKSKYCTADKVQIMFSNAPRQIICSKDGYLFLRDKDVCIHRYLKEPQRKNMPYSSTPTSKWHATHLFNYGQVYAKFTSDRAMNECFFHHSDGFILSFVYFHKLNNGEAVVCEFYLSECKQEQETEIFMNREELIKWLYDVSEVKGKYIFDYMSGIQYAKSPLEEISISRFLDLSDEAIVKWHNLAKEPIRIFDYCPFILGNGKATTEKPKDDESWKANTIDEITEFSMTNWGFMHDSPVLLAMSDEGITAYEFEVICCSKDSYKVKSKKTSIVPDMMEFLTSATTSDYTRDPNL